MNSEVANLASSINKHELALDRIGNEIELLNKLEREGTQFLKSVTSSTCLRHACGSQFRDIDVSTWITSGNEILARIPAAKHLLKRQSDIRRSALDQLCNKALLRVVAQDSFWETTYSNAVTCRPSETYKLKKIVSARVDYPKSALRFGRQGFVSLEYEVLPSGTPVNVRLVESSGPQSFVEEAMKTVKAIRYEPFDIYEKELIGLPRVSVRYKFELE